mmetsp:Transcript_11739/g.27190  ORF Transcript_11739/g.27190 Transcript_11739/m.27190 type:complete len:306 (-) Transcript_11739:115-1032(-)
MLASTDPHYPYAELAPGDGSSASAANGETADACARGGAPAAPAVQELPAGAHDNGEARGCQIVPPPRPKVQSKRPQHRPAAHANHEVALKFCKVMKQLSTEMACKSSHVYMQKVFALPRDGGRFGFFDMALLSAFFSCTFHYDKNDALTRRAREKRDGLLEAAQAFLQAHPGVEGEARAWVQSLLSELPGMESTPTGCFYRTSSTQGDWDLYTYMVYPKCFCAVRLEDAVGVVFFAAQIMHATSLCIAVHRGTGQVFVLGIGRKKRTWLPGIWAWGECESAAEKEEKAKQKARAESHARRNAAGT